MPYYYGNSKDGSDAKEFKGFHTSPNGKYWGTKPITLSQQTKLDKMFSKKKKK